MSTFTLKRKAFTIYDETDNLKRMKDSDILAEKKKEKPSLAPSALAAGTGAVGGGALGAGLGLIMSKKGAKLQGAGKLGKTGAIIGASAMAVSALNKRSKEKKENQFYNDRLEYAQRQAVRRERKDWKSNMTQREGYSY